MFSGDTFKRFLRTLGAAPTTAGQFGYTTSTSLGGQVSVSGATNYTILTGLAVPVSGLYIVDGFASFASFNSTGSMVNPQFYIEGSTTGVLCTTYGPINIYTSIITAFPSVCAIKQLVAGETLKLAIQYTSTAGSTQINTATLKMVRIV